MILKVIIIYLILFAASFFAIQESALDNPAITFFIPSIFAMVIFGRSKLSNPEANVFKEALFAALLFSALTVGLSYLFQIRYNWIKNESLMYFIAIAGNVVFPLMIYPRIYNAQNTQLP